MRLLLPDPQTRICPTAFIIGLAKSEERRRGVRPWQTPSRRAEDGAKPTSELLRGLERPPTASIAYRLPSRHRRLGLP